MTDGPLTVAVGRGPVEEPTLVALARARVVRGPSRLVAVVRHLLPPVTHVEVGEAVARPDDDADVVLLVEQRPDDHVTL